MRLLALVLALGIAVPALPCDTPGVCSDTASSFLGQVLGDGIRLDWSTDADAATTVDAYVLRRHLSGSTQLVSVAAVYGRGTCATLESYGYTDHPPAGAWIYRLEVWKGGSSACAHETVPQ